MKTSENIVQSVEIKDLVVGQIYCDIDGDSKLSTYLLFVKFDEFATYFRYVGGDKFYILWADGLIRFLKTESPFYITAKCRELADELTSRDGITNER